MSSQKSRTDQTFRLLEIDVSEVKDYPNVIKDILLRRSFEGIVVRNVFSAESLGEVVSRLDNDFMQPLFVSLSAILKEAKIPYKVPDTFGEGIISSMPNPDLEKYFAYASPYRQACSQLFMGTHDFETRIESVFQAFSNGLDVKVPTRPDGRTYTSSTIRVLEDGGQIPIHVGNEFLDLPQSFHLNSLVDLSGQLSYFIPLSNSDDGGELIVYRLEWNSDEGNTVPSIPQEAESFLNQFESTTLKPSVGDLLIFDGGRFYHRVTPVIGQAKRRTIGGFLSLSKQHDAVYYWA